MGFLQGRQERSPFVQTNNQEQLAQGAGGVARAIQPKNLNLLQQHDENTQYGFLSAPNIL